MTETRSEPGTTAHSEREMRVVGLVYAVALVGLTVFNVFTMRPPLSPANLLAYVLLSLTLAALYALAMPWAIQMMAHGLIFLVLMFGLVAAIVFLLALLLRGQAELYFYLLIFDGYAGFVYYTGQRRWGIVYVLGLIALAGLSYVLVAGWPAAGRALLSDLPWFGLTAVLSELMIRQWEHRERAEELMAELAEAHRCLQDYAAQIESLSVARERARLAHEIHDSVGHALTALTIQLALLAKMPQEQFEERQRTVERALTLAEQGLTDVRRAVQALRPSVLETFSLPEATAELVDDFEQTAQIHVTWQVTGAARPLSPRRALLLYRAAQEALTNVRRHAPAAQRVTMRLSYEPESVSLSVTNDGVRSPSIPPAGEGEGDGGYGLRGLRERAEALGGTFRAAPDEPGDFLLTMILPAGEPPPLQDRTA